MTTYHTSRYPHVPGHMSGHRHASFAVHREGEQVAYLSLDADIPFDGELAEKVAAVFAEHEQAMSPESGIAPPAMPDSMDYWPECPARGEVWLHDGERVTIDGRHGRLTVIGHAEGVPCGLYLISELTRPPVVADSLNIWVCAGAAGNRLWTGSAGCPDDRPAGRLHVWSDGDVTWEPIR